MRLLQVSNSGFETPVIASHRTRQERDLEQGEHGAEPEPSPPSSSQRLSSKLRRSLFLDSALPFKDKGVQTPEPSETEADSQLGSEPINDAINEAKDKKDDEEKEKMLRKTSTAQRRISMRKLIRTVLMKALMVHKKAIRRKIRRKRTRRRSLRTFFSEISCVSWSSWPAVKFDIS